MSKIKVEFLITGDEFDPNEITKLINIEPIEAYYKNEVFYGGPDKNIPMNRKETSWGIETQYVESIDVQTEIRKLYDILKNKKSELISILGRYNVKYKFVIVIYFRNENPIIGIDREIVKFASDINAEFDFDTYV